MKKFDGFLEHVLDQLDGLGSVEARRMFGGAGFYRDGVFFAIVFRGRFYMKTDEASRRRYTKAGMKPFCPNSRQTLTSYYEVPADVIENRAALAKWAQEALRAAGR